MWIVLSLSRLGWGNTSKPPTVQTNADDSNEGRFTKLILPFVFYTESFDYTGGLAGGASGFQEGQAGLYGAGLTTANSTTAFYLVGTDLRLPATQRWFMDSFASIGWFDQKRDYVSDSPYYPLEQGGSNGSSPDNYLISSGWDNWVELTFKYITPWGDGEESPVQRYALDRGLLASPPTGGRFWNPRQSGMTFFTLKPFYRYRSFDFESLETTWNNSGLEGALVYDNRDYAHNPECGSRQHLSVARDFGALESANTWTTLQGSYSKYLSFGETEAMRQRVLAFNVWASDNVTLKEGADGVVNRAPPYMGSSLGGLYRLRGYPQYRFHDKVAIYYGAEYRLIPEWNPLRNMRLLRFLDIDWMQFVGIVEAGRVDRSWSPETLYRDLRWDAGIGFRFMTRRTVVRLDTLASPEGWGMYAMVGQPF